MDGKEIVLRALSGEAVDVMIKAVREFHWD